MSFPTLIRRFLASFAFAAAVLAFAQDKPSQPPPAPTPVDNKAAAREAYKQGRARGSNAEGIALLRKAVELDPGLYEAHEYYIFFHGIQGDRRASEEERKATAAREHAEIEKIYLDWAREHPEQAGYQYGLGHLNEYQDHDKAVAYCKKAVELDPHCAPAFDDLAILAEVKGDLAASRDYFHQAILADPDEVTYWRHYVGSWGNADVDRGVEIARDMAKRFPDDAAAIVAFLAMTQVDEKRSLEIYAQLARDFPDSHLPSAYIVQPYFAALLKADPAKALAAARGWAARNPKIADFNALVDLCQAVIDANALIAQGKGDEALAVLDKVQLSRVLDHRTLNLTRARAQEAAGHPDQAYASLLGRFASAPDDDTRAALGALGAKLGKTSPQVDAEVASKRLENVKPGLPFTLTEYATGKPVSLDDFKGRVVLVNFWYPLCGPCRGEFPFLQAILEKYKDRGFAILAVNGHPLEDARVLPLMKGFKLGFEPLKSTEQTLADYKVSAFPANFLYGPDGQIHYRPPTITTASGMRELELQIEALLN